MSRTVEIPNPNPAPDAGSSPAAPQLSVSPPWSPSPVGVSSPSAGLQAIGPVGPVASPLSPPRFGVACEQLRLIVVHERALTAEETQAITKHYRNVVTLNPVLHQNKNDLDNFSFDALLVDITNKKVHDWYDEIKQQAVLSPGIKLIGLRRNSSFCSNASELWDDLQVDSVIKRIPIGVDDVVTFVTKLLANRGVRASSSASVVAGKVLSRVGK